MIVLNVATPSIHMTSREQPNTEHSRVERVPLTQLPRLYGLSLATWRRAIRLLDDPLPHARILVSGGNPARARILVRLVDVEKWLARRAVAEPGPRELVDEIVAKATGR